jgi:hypothetical protein
MINCTIRHKPYQIDAKNNAIVSHSIHGRRAPEWAFLRFRNVSNFIVTRFIFFSDITRPYEDGWPNRPYGRHNCTYFFTDGFAWATREGVGRYPFIGGHAAVSPQAAHAIPELDGIVTSPAAVVGYFTVALGPLAADITAKRDLHLLCEKPVAQFFNSHGSAIIALFIRPGRANG